MDRLDIVGRMTNLAASKSTLRTLPSIPDDLMLRCPQPLGISRMGRPFSVSPVETPIKGGRGISGS